MMKLLFHLDFGVLTSGKMLTVFNGEICFISYKLYRYKVLKGTVEKYGIVTSRILDNKNDSSRKILNEA